LLAGVLGVVCMALLAIGPIAFMLKHGGLGSGKAPGAGAKEAAASLESDAEAREERARRIEASGLNLRYTVIPLHSELIAALYEKRDFALLESRLAERYEKRADPYHAHLYARCINLITRFEEGPGPERMQETLDAWVAAMPDSYRAKLVRGIFHLRLALHHEGRGISLFASRSGGRSFKAEVELARADLEAARALEPGDAEIPVNLATISLHLGEDRAATERLCREAITLNPMCLSARVALINAAHPSWGGSWEAVDQAIAECEAASANFPLLLVAKREGQQAMGDRSRAHAARLKSDEQAVEWSQVYVEQLKRNPDDPMLMANAAYFAANGRDFERADYYFRILGERYPEGTNYKDLMEYNDYRGNSCAAVARAMPLGPERTARIAEALKIAPDHFYTNYLYGVELAASGDPDGARMYLERSREVKPSYVWSTYRLAEVAEQSGRKADAVSLAKEVLSMGPDEEQRSLAKGIIERNS
jgi:tetratricopeptide (TPR) repeat protein